MLNNLIFEKFDKIIDHEIGTIRTTPENYYVCTVYNKGCPLVFEGIEVNTRNINKDAVYHWANMKNIFGDGLWR